MTTTNTADGCTAPTGVTGNRANGHAGNRGGPFSGASGHDGSSSAKQNRSSGGPHVGAGGAAGVEIRVHGIGDHATYSALGTPDYKELVDSRVWIGEIPRVPPHKLRLVNWSRANRKLTRHLSWYLAFPFTLLNVAGYMEPEQKVPRHVMRVAISVASLCLTIAMAAWITVILETTWRALTHTDDRLTGIVLQAAGPCLLIVVIVYRMIVGRVLVDKGGTLISVFSIFALVGMIWYLHSKPASRFDGPFHRYLVDIGDLNAIDPMTVVVGGTTVIVWSVALCLCLFAWRKGKAGAGYAGSAVLLVLAVSLLHAAGSTLRLFTASIFSLVPSSGQGEHSVPSTLGSDGRIGYVLLAQADGLNSAGQEYIVSFGKALRIDLIPIFFIVMMIVFGGLLWISLWWRRDRGIAKSPATADPKSIGRTKKETQPVSRIHFLVEELPARFACALIVAMLATVIVWVMMIIGFATASAASSKLIDVLMIGLRVLGAVAVAMLVLRRPEKVAEQLRRTFGAVADIAGFWAPDLHPLAGASYRRGLLSGIRQAINDLVLNYPNEPIALVGHSQGSVVCAWFVRGGHWTEHRAEGMTDREALKRKMYEVKQARNQAPPTEIALFTCGSPLHSLYATFFPRYFGGDFFSTTKHMTCGWRNYWRKTDPIGTALPALSKRDNVDVTEMNDEETLGHSEYWREERLRRDIRKYLDSACPQPSKKPAQR